MDKMCSIPGLPTPGSNISVFITRVNLDPQCELVELWGRFAQDRKVEYQHLRKEIQFPRETFRELEGDPGDMCLVQVYETWYRARIVSKRGSSYTVFLIDEGRMLGATSSVLAWGQKEFFHLPPELEFCVLSNVLPLSTENRWSPMALEFLKSLCGKTVDAFVQDVLVPHRTFLLDIPFITRQMHEMGFAKKLNTEKFKFHVLHTLQRGASNSTESLQTTSIRNVHEQIEKQQHYLYPELQTETVETVIVTEVTNPLRIFCQLKVFSQELKKLTEQITQHYEGRLAACIARPQTLGSPCASRGSDGRWYRSVLQQVFPAKNVVEVLHVDYGKKQFVQVENIRPLATDFFRMPVVTYVCSLHGILDKGVGWTAAQIEYLKSLLLNRTVIAKFEYQSLSEGVHYVTLYGDENTNINNLFGKKEKCLLDSASASNPDGKVNQKTAPPCSGDPKKVQTKYPAEDLLVNSSHVAVVQHVENPSEFWIQTNTYADEFDEMMNDLADLYSNSVGAGVVECPQVGLYCAGRSQDNSFYRATVSEINGNKVKVFFVDYGNTEIIDRFNLRVLPDEFKVLPGLACKCRLAGIEPKDGTWSRNATDFFIKTIADKILDLHVTARSHGSYIVQLTDLSAQGERDAGKLLCSAGFAEKFDSSIPPRKAFTGPVIAPTTQNPHAISYVFRSSGSPQDLSTSNCTVKESRTPFKEYLFPIGSSFEVTVSYIESPNDFWCQLAQNSNHLKWLMQDIQKHYAVTQFGQPLEAACVARHPDNGMWYRALVIQKHATMHVDVLFIDYGQTKRVSVRDLRAIDPKFLQLKGQAFRCSLYNLIHPASHTTEWTEEAVAQFQNFVDNATTEHGMLKCTIYAVMYDAQKVVFNVVDLQTPFQSVCGLMVHKGFANRAPAKNAPSSLFRLETYYYSTHNIKTGSEEEVIVTSVNSVNHFYCQLKRNSDTIKGLSESVNTLCHQLEMTNCPQTFGTVCFAKYMDGEWYRAQIKCTNPTILVHFVDYGDTLEVQKSDLLPIPIEASEIMSVPVQAVQCGLSDIPGEVPSVVNSWFETSMTDRNFRALVVAKEPGGKLLVELYDDKMQVNAKIKEKFNLEMHSKEQVIIQSCRPQALEPKPRFTPKKVLRTDEDSLKCEKLPRVHNRIPYETQAALRRPNEKVNLKSVETTNQGELNVQTETKYSHDANSSPSENRKKIVVPKANANCLPKLIDLPSKSVKPGLVADVFISHCNSPQSFFVQLIEEEAEIFSLVEKLNDGQSTAASIQTKDLCQGDLVNAVFPEDYSWYRAVVREILENQMALVEFVDFGNTATVSVSEMCRLDKNFLEIPRFSIHCCLCGVLTVESKLKLDPKVVSNFKESVGIIGSKRLGCMFVKQSGSVWEVSLVDGDKAITCNFSPSVPTDTLDLLPENTDQEAEECNQKSTLTNLPPKCNLLVNVMTACYSEPEISEGQSLEVYASTINGPESFWCQSADSDKLDKITEVVVEAEKAVASTFIDTETLCTGSPCIAQFEDDEQWYRAKVLRKDGDTLYILFVDYGNESAVNMKDVRPVPALLIDIPPQAFWCQLEGFDLSQGSWDDTASDQLSQLIMDKLLHLTVLRVSSQEEVGITCFVKVKCEEEVINYTMKQYWKSSIGNRDKTSEDKLNPTEEALSYDMSSLADELQLVEKKAAVLDSPLKKQNENFKDHDTDDPQACNETHEEVVDGDSFYEQQVSVITQVTDNVEEDVDLINFQEKYCLDYGNTASVVNELVEEKQSKTTEIHEQKTVTRSTNSAVKAPKEGIETMSTIICEGPSDAGLECVSDSGDSSEIRVATSQMYTDRSGSASVVKKSISLDDFESQLYIDEDFEISLSNIDESQDDIYEEVFKICAEPVVESEKSKKAVLEEIETKDKELFTLIEDFENIKEESGIQDEAEGHCAILPEPVLEFSKLYSVEQTFPLGSSCFVWSSAKKSWCNAKIVKIFEDSIKVLLLDDDTEMVVDPHSIFQLPTEPEQIGDVDVSSWNPGSERDKHVSDPIETDGCEDAITGDHHSNAFSEGLLVEVDHEIIDSCKTFVAMSTKPEKIHQLENSHPVCAPLEEFSDVPKKQLIDIGQANDAVLSVSTQEKDDVMLEEDMSCHGDLTSDLIKDCTVVSTDHRAESEKNIFAEVVSSAPPQEKEDPGESTCPNKDCLEFTEHGALTLEDIKLEFTPSAPTQDMLKDDVLLEDETYSPIKNSAEVVMSHVMHLTLRVEEKSDDDIIFVSETLSTQELQ
ncbi:tudor domain-containing protein 6 isoform X3 [Esox lucius]|uniref:tudor domain-containing protein 6 isoform X3 n=1 Tax=Esox lucius TaxID=8010 RepID=UPI0014775705|nr:tudor domain-containing protein 6 isoform X3 [Esox lucius]